MSIASRHSVCSMLLILFFFIAASKVQAQAPVTEFDRQMARVTLGVLGAEWYDQLSDISGTIINTTTTQSLNTSNTVGALATLRYVVKPYVGLEANYSYARYNENFSNFTIPLPHLAITLVARVPVLVQDQGERIHPGLGRSSSDSPRSDAVCFRWPRQHRLHPHRRWGPRPQSAGARHLLLRHRYRAVSLVQALWPSG